ncbi:hypothetical protein [Mesorhizobium sp. NZP2077]|uniref:hypothetical protein n=1 Tax=Mesorhizobium sp. NZP2077 TaxID=2483404 RepID=UPI001551DF2E|nr:hypothetical protein [Mesorhizobium sp. NZP2077]QKC83285.1 hypothetical protein EB232_18160 [Mesorhizobium sp. NZP2077]QKD16802.1 hypothetical protein HGP13_17945 [Mesorhizobium sp. NZP2077]
MMPGVAAQPLGHRSIADDTLLTFDPVNGIYSVAGVAVAAGDIVDQPELIVAGVGLVIAESGNVVAIVGAALDYLLTANWTASVGWDHFEGNGNIYPLVVSAADDDTIQLRRYAFSFVMDAQDFTGGNNREATDVTVVGAGVHKVAVTRTDAELAFSIDGRAVVSDSSSSFAITPTGAALGGYPGDVVFDAITIRSFRVWLPKDSSLLPALSA